MSHRPAGAGLTDREADHLLARLTADPGTLSEPDVRGVAAALADRLALLERREAAVVLREERTEAECGRLVQEAAEVSEAAAAKLSAAEAKMAGAEKFLSTLEADRAAHTAAVAEAERETDKFRAALQTEQAERVAALEEQFGLRTREVEAEAAADLAAARERASAADAKLEEDRTALDRLRDQLDEDWHDLEADREQLAKDRARFEADQTAARELLEQERAVLENRLSFREAHLERTAEELRQARAEWDRRVQTVRTALAESADRAGRRRRQLDRYRDLLDRRDAGLAAAAARTAADAADTAEAARRRREQAETDAAAAAADAADRQTRLAETEAMLNTRTDGLAAKERSLDALRGQLETAHRETLALRVAVEELLPQLKDAGPAAPVGLRLEESRRKVLAYLDQREDAVTRRADELKAAKAAVARQSEELETQRRLLAAWEGERRDAAADREAELLRRAAAVAARDELLAAARDRSRAETEATARILRDLLREMEETLSDRIAADPQVFRLPAPDAEPVRAVVTAEGVRRAA